MSRTPKSRTELVALIGGAALVAAVFSAVAEASPVPPSPSGAAGPVLAPGGNDDPQCKGGNNGKGQDNDYQCTDGDKGRDKSGDKHRHRYRHRHRHGH
jgi:hypothetical protein